MRTTRAIRWGAAATVAALLGACSLAENDPATSEPSVRRSDAAASVPTASGAQAVAGRSDDGPARKVDPRDGGLEVGFGEFAITLEADEIRPGPVTFEIRNGGALVHGFEIQAEDDDGDNSGPGNGELKLEGPEFGPNEAVRIHADLPPGVYEIECFVAEHDDRGMRTTLVVTPDAPLVRADRPDAQPGSVAIAGFAFEPSETHVEAGTEVTWTNRDPEAHTVTADDGTFDSGTMDAGAEFAFRFDQPGTYAYACLIHPSMRGTVHVA